jgi:hypothetical protein
VEDQEISEKLSLIRKRSLPRLSRSFMNFFIGETRWQKLQNTLLPRFKDCYHRMDIEFYGEEPELDDVQSMPGLQQQAAHYATWTPDIQQCADNIIASLFYVELNGLPVF